MSVAALARRITQFGFDLLEGGFAIDAKAHVADRVSHARTQLQWVRDDPTAALISGDPARIEDYVALIERHEYSFLMLDGGLVQLAYTFEGDAISRHRLVYHPCPFVIDAALLEDHAVSLSDLICEIYMHDLEEAVVFRSPIRFDFAPEAAADFHPASHVTINSQSCRIPVRSPMRFDQFIMFVLENFYPDVLLDEKIFRSIVRGDDEECLSIHDKSRLHLNWATQV